MDVGILYTRVNEAIGFCFDYTVFHMSDFYQFVIYYCHAIIVVHYVDGRLIAEHKRTNKEAVLRQSENVNARKWLRKW